MKVGLISLGCPKNLVDSEVMLGLAQGAGHELTRDASEAEVLVVNTCAFIDKAKQESIDTILEMAELKKTGHCKTLVVTGCMAERYRDELKAQIPEIDAVLGTGEVPAIVGAIGGQAPSPIQLLRANGEPVRLRGTGAGAGAALADVAPTATPAARPTYIYDADTPRLLATPRHYAYLKIAEGCDYKCA
ncbi:MAG: 30S ribosomal protein S12 methylthiotransferase RimO, partial [Vicinamibacterales bacterium]